VQLHHPNIVQFLGVVCEETQRDRERSGDVAFAGKSTGMPAWLMWEWMPKTLAQRVSHRRSRRSRTGRSMAQHVGTVALHVVNALVVRHAAVSVTSCCDCSRCSSTCTLEDWPMDGSARTTFSWMDCASRLRALVTVSLQVHSPFPFLDTPSRWCQLAAWFDHLQRLLGLQRFFLPRQRRILLQHLAADTLRPKTMCSLWVRSWLRCASALRQALVKQPTSARLVKHTRPSHE